jgi:hypothetical protein
MGASAIVGASSARQNAKAQQTSMLYDAAASDRNAVTANNAALVAENNAELAGWQSREALRQGENDVTSIQDDRSAALAAARNEAATVKSKQKVGMAANGVDVGSGSAVDVLTSTDYVGELNANAINDSAARNVQTVRDNAIKNAWGYQVQGIGYKDQAATSRADAALYRFDAGQQRAGSKAISPNSAAAVSLIGSAGQVASSWYSMGKGK